VTSEAADSVRRFAHWVACEHPEALGERGNGLDWRIAAQEVVKSMMSRERDERSVIVRPVELGHPVVGLVGSNGSGSTGRCNLILIVIRSAEVTSSDDVVHVGGDGVGIDDRIETHDGEQTQSVHVPRGYLSIGATKRDEGGCRDGDR